MLNSTRLFGRRGEFRAALPGQPGRAPLLLAPLEQTAKDAVAEVARELGVDVIDGVVRPVASP